MLKTKHFSTSDQAFSSLRLIAESLNANSSSPSEEFQTQFENLYYHTLIKYQQLNRDNLGEYISAKVKLFNLNFGFHQSKNKSTRVTNRLIAMPDKNVTYQHF